MARSLNCYILFMRDVIKEKIALIESLFQKMEKNKNVSLIEILKEEIIKLRALNEDYRLSLSNKKVIATEHKKTKYRYQLKDGSTYVVSKQGKYRYLYDSKTKIMTYEFSNGQVERTFPGGLKEIRYPDGSITIKDGTKDYEYIQCNKNW
ncbi:hypothetical protein TCON_0975 [Astathelohania contejeani]|uniref:Uncharacterized protein n=1 Tax=Astathelohania contejeani TaxID=164912 RepID=A0ABQ7I091_9MICR|nr:hypothetical protein TCON_0975 [Thelohania contejeani]